MENHEKHKEKLAPALRKKQNKADAITVSIAIIAIITILTIVLTIMFYNINKTDRQQPYKPDTKLASYDFTQKWENTNTSQINLLITTKCEIVSINFTLDFKNENGAIIRTLTDTKMNLKKNQTYAFSYTFKSNEKKVIFTLINGEITPNTRDDIGDNGGLG